MLQSQKTAMRMSEIRETVHRLDTDAPGYDRTVEKHKRELADLEKQFRCQCEAEQSAHPHDGESRARAELHGRASVRAILDAVCNQRATEGAEAEAQRDAGVPADAVPWGMLTDPAELRVDADAGTPASVGAQQRPIIDRVFTRSAMMALGVQMPNAPVGDELFYVVTAGAAGAFADGVAAVDSEAFTLAPTTLKPKRLTAGYLIAQEDTERLRGYEPALRMDLRNTLSNRLDDQTIGLGNATQRGFLATAANGGIAARSAPSDIVSYLTALSESAQGVDGVYASSLADLAWVVGDDTYRKLAALINSGSGATSTAYHMTMLKRFRASANVPAPSSGNVQEGIIAKLGRPGPNAICPVWGGGPRIVRDEVTQASTGRIRLTALAFYSFAVLRADGFSRTSLKLA